MAPRERDFTAGLNDSPSYAPTEDIALTLKEQDKWMAKVDIDAFREDMKALGKRLSAEQGPADVAHLHKFILWSNMLTFSGIVTMGLVPTYYILPALVLSLGCTSRWTMIAHHTCHGGYDNCEKTGRFNRFKFAIGSTWRRFMDWFDWMHPEAWNVEHNNLHHYHLSEDGDPDLVERNLAAIRESNLPMFVRYLAVFFMASSWKWLYYAPNTYKELRIKETRKTDPKLLEKCMENPAYDLHAPYMFYTYFSSSNLPPFLSLRELIGRVLGPFFLYRFMLLPSPWLLLGYMISPDSPTDMYINAIKTLMLADVFANFHSFLIVVTNHAGHDLYKFDTHCKPRSGTFYLRQVISSVNFAAGTDLVDFLHGFLNYQIEHHIWPDLSMRSYQKALPQVKALCAYHNVPYIQESVFIRLKKTVDIMVGKASMRPFPEGIIVESESQSQTRSQ